MLSLMLLFLACGDSPETTEPEKETQIIEDTNTEDTTESETESETESVAHREKGR